MCIFRKGLVHGFGQNSKFELFYSWFLVNVGGEKELYDVLDRN